MYRIILVSLMASLLLPILSQAQMDGNQVDAAKGDYIRLVAALDEPEFYCLDLTGYGDHLVLDDPLQAHTCKLNNAADQMFSVVTDQIKVIGYERCLQLAGSGNKVLPGTAVIVRECDAENPLQKISLTDSGHLSLLNSDYCIGVGQDTEKAFGPSHVWRTLTTVKCETAKTELSIWQLGIN